MAHEVVTRTFEILKAISAETDITFWGADEILRSPCAEVTEADFKNGMVDRVAAKLEKNLKFYRDKTGIGRGIAAPQVGENLRIITIYLNDIFETLINPVIIRRSQEDAIYREGCLSSLPLTARVVRPHLLTVDYLTPDGRQVTKQCNEIESRLLGHELDHLDGIWFADKAAPGTLRMVYDLKSLLSEKLELI
jgi:peptide deformylase